MNSAQENDELTMKQMEAISSEIKMSQPLISEVINPNDMLELYEAPGFRKGIDALSKNFGSMRKIRGDGNCFYRGFLFQYLEQLLLMHTSSDADKVTRSEAERVRLHALAISSMADLESVGYSELALEMFYDEFCDLCRDLFTFTPTTLLNLFISEDGSANYYTWFMRLLTAGFLKKNGDRFLPFADGLYFDIDEYCKIEVEPMNKECEQLQIVALSEYLRIPVKIIYLDGRDFDEKEGLPVITFAEGCNPNAIEVTLLYRPGHYDVLYARLDD